jgi:hypothetical protein
MFIVLLPKSTMRGSTIKLAEIAARIEIDLGWNLISK